MADLGISDGGGGADFEIKIWFWNQKKKSFQVSENFPSKISWWAKKGRQPFFSPLLATRSSRCHFQTWRGGRHPRGTNFHYVKLLFSNLTGRLSLCQITAVQTWRGGRPPPPPPLNPPLQIDRFDITNRHNVIYTSNSRLIEYAQSDRKTRFVYSMATVCQNNNSSSEQLVLLNV